MYSEELILKGLVLKAVMERQQIRLTHDNSCRAEAALAGCISCPDGPHAVVLYVTLVGIQTRHVISCCSGNG